MRRTALAFLLGVLAACGAQQVDAPSPLADDSSIIEGSTAEDQPRAVQPVASDDPEFVAISLVVVGSLDQPVDAAVRSGDDAVYFVSRVGTVWRFVNGVFEGEPVLDISDLTDGDGERGLLGLAFSNDGATAYVNYTNLSGDSTIASVTVDSSGTFNRDSLRTLLTIEQPFRNHNAGDIIVEPSGMLLVPMGDGGSADDPQRVALNEASLLGKVIRLDPIAGTVRVLAKGLRNPWRVDLFEDRLWMADVGQNQWEEVSVLDDVSRRVGTAFRNSSPAGGSTSDTSTADIVDFGWSAYEANLRFNDDQSSPNHTPPVVAYQHGDDGCSVSGGAVATSGALRGRYVFGDYCSGRVWSIATDETSPVMTLHFENVDAMSAIVRVGSDLYVLSLSGTIWKFNG
jgi:hypothetical protein